MKNTYEVKEKKDSCIREPTKEARLRANKRIQRKLEKQATLRPGHTITIAGTEYRKEPEGNLVKVSDVT